MKLLMLCNMKPAVVQEKLTGKKQRLINTKTKLKKKL